ncbi:MAG: hypothetical protein ACOC6A_01290 [Chloroflexota bacterium]
MAAHSIVYLDANYLSNMAKARLGQLNEVHDPQFWLRLYQELYIAVCEDRIMCPALDLQIEEASFDTRIVSEVCDIVSSLSVAGTLTSYTAVVEQRVLEAAVRFLGRGGESPRTSHAMRAGGSRPSIWDKASTATGRQGLRSVARRIRSQVVEYERRKKAKWAATGLQRYKHYSAIGWTEALRREKESYVDAVLGAWGQDEGKDSVRRLQTRLGELGMGRGEFEQFKGSPHLMDEPIVDVECSVRAATARYSRSRRQRGSDLRDAAILGCTIPNCDMVTTDRFMKQLVTEHLGLDARYGCEVYSARKADRLRFERRISESTMAC